MNTYVERDGLQFSPKLVAACLGWWLLGTGMGAVGMIWQYEQTPVATVEQDGAGHSVMAGPTSNSAMPAPSLAIEQQFAQYKADQAARFARIDQRLEELTFAARKLAGVKQNWDVKIAEVGR